MIRSRFAPSPTGDLHVGSAWTAIASWALAREHDRGVGGRTILRVEDIDTPRVVRGSTDSILEDLAWLGLDWDEGPTLQSSRIPIYEAAIAKLEAAGLTYRCDCSRAEIARAASAPHAGDAGSQDAIYPGTCRDAPNDRELKRAPAIRLRVPSAPSPSSSPSPSIITFNDGIHGRIEEDVAQTAGDFVLRRGDDVFAYQLVVAIDDAAMSITHVVRADDLLASTARQILLMNLLGYESIPNYVHVPLVVASDGERLAKRTRGSTIKELAKRYSRDEVIGTLAHGLGLTPSNAPTSAQEVAKNLRPPSEWRRHPWRLPKEWSV